MPNVRRVAVIVLILAILAALGAYSLSTLASSVEHSTGANTSSTITNEESYIALTLKHQNVTEYALSPSSEPSVVAVDTDGTVWSVLQNSSSLAELDPSSSEVHQFYLPLSSRSGPLETWGIAIDSARHLVWFTDQTSNSVWSFNITSHVFHKYALPIKNSFPFGIAVDASGDAWFTEYFASKVGEITTSGNLTQWNATTSDDPFAEPAGITIDKQTDAVWFTLLQGSSVCSFLDGKLQLYNLSAYGVSYLTGVALDSSGNLWLTQHGPSLISEFNPATGYFRSISTSIPPLNTSLPYFVQVDHSNRVWFDEHYGNSIGVFNPQNDSLVEYLIPPGPAALSNLTGAVQIGLGPNGGVWFPELYTGRIGVVNGSQSPAYVLSIANTTLQLKEGGSSTTIKLSTHSTCACEITLDASSGNSSGNLSFSFSPDSGSGNFSSTLTITSGGMERGIEFVTVSARSALVIVSKVIEIRSTV